MFVSLKYLLVAVLFTLTNISFATNIATLEDEDIAYFLESSPNEILRYDPKQGEWLDKVSH